MSEEVPAIDTEVSGDEIALNKVVTFHYRLREVDEEGNYSDLMEESYGHEPLYYLHGFHNVIIGLERELEGKKPGDAVEVILDPLDAYGVRVEKALLRVPIKHLMIPPGTKKIVSGTFAAVETNEGRRNVTVVKAGKFNADVDFNHPYAGKTLYYQIEVVTVRDATQEEIDHGHVHGPGGHKH
ncbi:MAG: FKBP-type peptidyl-prolyl cis-trans isomerase [Gammaproteobacteria bacterium]|jgi:FKBP-type peptidyl-prolyl cis-trans isomerase 2|nr:FKBP-type peptidyl-prolyl cis-trans isomerase [Gammaproteobacteria bacterium]|tara:strand:- start:483 stop:1031 length:549 start_codon:yes stop_codon:yes gene_type:complete